MGNAEVHGWNDEELVAKARRGDAIATEVLVRRHLPGAYAVALAHMGEPADAEDVVQDAMVQALRRLAECRDPGRFAAWLVAIVRNLARDVHRRRRVAGQTRSRARESWPPRSAPTRWPSATRRGPTSPRQCGP